MKNLVRNKLFLLGFCFGILLIAIFNFYTLILIPKKTIGICFDCYDSWGFPFVMYEWGTMLHLHQFRLVGVIANIIFTVVFSFIAGLIFRFIWSKFQEKSLK